MDFFHNCPRYDYLMPDIGNIIRKIFQCLTPFCVVIFGYFNSNT